VAWYCPHHLGQRCFLCIHLEIEPSLGPSSRSDPTAVRTLRAAIAERANLRLTHQIEGALQASGRAGEHQVKDVNASFVGARAPIVQGTTFIFVKEPH